MIEFLITAKPSDRLIVAIRQVNGKPINNNAWITRGWEGDAESLCRHLRPSAEGRIIVCALSGDWSYW